MEKLLDLLQMDYLGVIATIIGFIYLYLEFQAKKSMWIASIVMAIFYIYIFYHSQFYAMSLIYAYFFIISIIGWRRWHKKQLAPAGMEASQSSVIPILRMPNSEFKRIALFLMASSILVAGLLILFTESSGAILLSDTIATSLNIVAIWMATRRWAEQWLLLIPANLLTTIMLFMQAQYPSSFMFLIYFIVSIFGYYHWAKMANNAMKADTDCTKDLIR